MSTRLKPIEELTDEEMAALPSAKVIFTSVEKQKDRYSAILVLPPLRIEVPMTMDDIGLLMVDHRLQKPPRHFAVEKKLRLTKGVRQSGFGAGKEMFYRIEIIFAGRHWIRVFLNKKQKDIALAVKSINRMFTDLDIQEVKQLYV